MADTGKAKRRISAVHLIRLPFYIFLFIALLTGVVFLVSGIAMEGGFKLAWEILLGIHTPFGDVSGLGVALSVLGYLAVPTIIGLVVADGITRFTEYRLSTVDEVAVRIAARIKPKIKQVVEEEEAVEEEEGTRNQPETSKAKPPENG